MLDRGKLLFIAVIYSTIHSHVTDVIVKPLNMTLNVVDDLYDGCHEEAREKFIPDLLKQELNMTEGFQKAWNANSRCSALIPGGTKDHTAALSVLHFGNAYFLKELSKAVETTGANITTYENNFHFKSLHFLLTDSMMKLNQSQRCKSTFAFMENLKEMPLQGSKVRFTSFTLVHSDFESLGDVGEETILKIESCFYIDLDDHICQQNLLRTLLSPAEVFTVKSIKHVNNEYTEVTLNHHSVNSTHNCYMFPRIIKSETNGVHSWKKNMLPVALKESFPKGPQRSSPPSCLFLCS